MKFNYRVFRFWRQQKNLTLTDVGKAVGASKQTVQKWEAGTVVPREAHIRALAKLFGISVYDISSLPPEPEVISLTAHLQAALEDPMFDYVVRSWDRLTAANKGEIIQSIREKLKAAEAAASGEKINEKDAR